MSKVSIGLQGWRFDESELFTEDGEYRPFDEMDPDTRRRLVRLSVMLGAPCDACWLLDEDPETQSDAQYVYGEPLAEVLLCAEHEPDFVYWFREAGGDRHAGAEAFDDRFHEWFLDGGRAPPGYDGMEYVDEGGDLPDPPTPDPEDHPELAGHMGQDTPGERIDFRRGVVEKLEDDDP
jgi:hypothetical protein